MLQTRRTDLSAAILTGGAIFYAVLCLPAIRQRGYPPIDYFWLAVTHLWAGPVALSAVFDSMTNPSRKWHLIWYALATGYVDSGTLVMGVPKMTSPLGMLILTIVGYGPLHLVGVFLTEFVMQSVLWFTRTLIDEPSAARRFPQISLGTWFVAFSVVCVLIGFPFAFRSFLLSAERQRAISLADEQWANGSAVIYGGDAYVVGDLQIESHVDVDSGLPFRHLFSDNGFRDAYNARIREHVRREGPPAWRKRLPSVKQLQAWLEADDLEEVTTFPYDVTPNLTLMRKGTIQNGSITYTNSYDTLVVVTGHELTGSGGGIGPVYVHRDGEWIVVRDGNEWVGVFREQGGRIVTARRIR